MSGLTNFLAPYSNLIFSHRNTIIVILGIILGCTALYALYGHWRVQRLEGEVRAARSGAGRQPMPRMYASAQPAIEERPAEAPGGLPPVKGGRTYARNLGSALQKAGIGSGPGGQPIYSPPVPPGWGPNTAASQPIAPSQPPLYSPASSTWGAPPPTTPWPSYPQAAPGPGRPSVNQPPPPQVPMYQPPPPASQPPQPQTFYPPAYPPAPLAAPPMGYVQQYAPPASPMAPPPPAPVPAVQPEPAAQESGRRGKGKRRRFNLSVLESLEKMVQLRQPAQSNQPQPQPQPQPQAAAPAPPTTAPAPPMATPVAPLAAPAPAMPAPTVPAPAWGAIGRAAAAPASEPAVVVPHAPTPVPASAEAPSLSLNFDSPPPSTPPSEAPAAEAKVEPKPDARLSMRSMLFGEEPATAAPAAAEETSHADEAESMAAAPEPEPAQESEVNASAWGATDEPVATEYSWQTAEPAADVHEPTSEGHELGAEGHEPAAESHEPAVESETQPEITPWEPSSWSSETSTVEEAVAPVETRLAEDHPAESVMAESSGDEWTESPATSDGGGSAGTMVIIEDDPTVAQYYATLFQGNGYRVEVANDGVSGVDLCTRVQPQVILLDVMMPRQNGILVLQTLRASDETRNTPVVVMSNFSEPTLIKRALQLGALEYVIKTQVEGPALLAAVPRWMNREKAFAA